MRPDDFDFVLPDSAIARYPATQRASSRLLLLDRRTGAVMHARFSELPGLLHPSDTMVTNDSRVLPARLTARKAASGGRIELLLIEPLGSSVRWRAMATGAKRLKVGQGLTLADGRLATIVSVEGEGFIVLELPADADSVCAALGRIPLPPYLGREAEPLDVERYQTVFSRRDVARSVAAPTAGLHFDPPVLAALDRLGIARTSITLDVGPGTFLPVRAERLDDHRMHEERFVITPQAARTIGAAAGRLVAVGTTVVRTLESLATISAGAASTRLFVRPGFEFRHVDAMLTNFHLPRSTLLMLVCAFAGTEAVLAAYAEAVAEGYRFYSYGDAMLIS